MDDLIKEILVLLKKERILIYKIVESEEKTDRVFFLNGTKLYNEIASNSDNLIDELIDNYSLKKIEDYIFDKYLDDDEHGYDVTTLIGLIENKCLNRISNNIYNENCDNFTNIINSSLYNTYLWRIKTANYSKELVKEIRYNMVSNLVNSSIMREYFKGNFDVFDELSYDGKYEDEIKKLYYNVLNNSINLSNSIEMFEGLDSDIQFESKKEYMKIEFVSLALRMIQENIKFPVARNEMSDFTQNIVNDASNILKGYNDKEKLKEKIIKL